MAAIGEASAVIGVVQIGFSLARTLNTYIGDYKDSRDSIIGLAAELDATIIQVKELNALVVSSKAASDGSKKLAEKCVKDSDRLIKKLVHLLTKAHQPEDWSTIVNLKPEDINVSRLTRAYWPLIKPQVDVVKSELHVMKTDILIARSCIQAQSGLTSAERSAGGDSIVALAKSRRLAKRLLEEAKAEEKRTAMPQQHRDHIFDRSPDRAVDDGPRTVRPPRRSSGQHAKHPYGSAADDGKATELMARDLRESILEDLQREEAERKAKEVADEEARNLAIQAYQKSVKDKLARLQEATDATQRQIEEIFGPAVDEKQVKMFLSEQQSRQMQDEFGETLLKFGVMPSLFAKGSVKGAPANSEEEGVRTPRRRWFSRRNLPHSLASSETSSYRTVNAPSDSTSRKASQFLHIALSYDSMEGMCNYQTFDNPALRHQPCGPPCNFEASMKVWQSVPRFAKQAASKWVENHFSSRTWHLHAALPIEKNVRKTRSLLQKAILGETVHQSTSDVLLVFTSTDDYAASDADTLTVNEDGKSVSSHAAVPASDVSRVELSKADIGQMREWLVSKGLSTKKVDELESMVLKRKHLASRPTQPATSSGDQASRNDRLAIDEGHNKNGGRRGIPNSPNTVRFVEGDVAPSTSYPGGGIDYQREQSKSLPYGSQSVQHSPRYTYEEYPRRPPPPPPTPRTHYDNIYEHQRRPADILENFPGPYVSGNLFSPAMAADADGYNVVHAYNARNISPSRQSRRNYREIEIVRERGVRARLARGRGRESSASVASGGYGTRNRDSSFDSHSSVNSVRPDSSASQRIMAGNPREDDYYRYDRYDQPYIEIHRQRRSRSPSATFDKSRSRYDISERRPPRMREQEELFVFDRAQQRKHTEEHARRNQRCESLSRSPVHRSKRISEYGTAVYNHPPQMPRTADNERPAPPLIPPGLSLERTDVIQYFPSRRQTFSDSEDEEFAARAIDRERDLERLRSDIRLEERLERRSRDRRTDHSQRYREDIAQQNISTDDQYYRPQYGERAQTRSNADVIIIRRELSPERIEEDAEDAEDAMLDDVELKNKMMSRYTSGTVHSVDSGVSQKDASSPEPQSKASDDGRRGDSPSFLDRAPKRQNTATVEEIDESSGNCSDAEAGANGYSPPLERAVVENHRFDLIPRDHDKATNGTYGLPTELKWTKLPSEGDEEKKEEAPARDDAGGGDLGQGARGGNGTGNSGDSCGLFSTSCIKKKGERKDAPRDGSGDSPGDDGGGKDSEDVWGISGSKIKKKTTEEEKKKMMMMMKKMKKKKKEKKTASEESEEDRESGEDDEDMNLYD